MSVYEKKSPQRYEETFLIIWKCINSPNSIRRPFCSYLPVDRIVFSLWDNTFALDMIVCINCNQQMLLCNRTVQYSSLQLYWKVSPRKLWQFMLPTLRVAVDEIVGRWWLWQYGHYLDQWALWVTASHRVAICTELAAKQSTYLCGVYHFHRYYNKIYVTYHLKCNLVYSYFKTCSEIAKIYNMAPPFVCSSCSKGESYFLSLSIYSLRWTHPTLIHAFSL